MGSKRFTFDHEVVNECLRRLSEICQGLTSISN